MLLSSCASSLPNSRTYYEYFDTVITVIGYDDGDGDGDGDEAEFDSVCDEIEDILKKYHTMTNIYSADSDVSRVNASAGKEAVTVPTELCDIIEYSIEMNELTSGKCNVAFGAVLSVWHDYRTRALDGDADVPPHDVLAAAAEHCDAGDVKIDRDGGTVYLADAEMSLDLGAIAKGWVADVIKDRLVDLGKNGYIVSVGGTVVSVGEKPNGADFVAGVENPDVETDGVSVVARFELDGDAVATSGSYQRYYEFNGVRYHHIIDSDTLYPKNEFLSVTVRADSAALADALSTALFNMSFDEGEALVDSLDGVEAFWVMADGETRRSDGFDIIG